MTDQTTPALRQEGPQQDAIKALDEARLELQSLGADHQRGALIANLAERIWDQCDAIGTATKTLRAALSASRTAQKGQQEWKMLNLPRFAMHITERYSPEGVFLSAELKRERHEHGEWVRWEDVAAFPSSPTEGEKEEK